MKSNSIVDLSTINATLRDFEAENESISSSDVIFPLDVTPTVTIRNPKGDPRFYDSQFTSVTVTTTAAGDYYGILGTVPGDEIWELVTYGAVRTAELSLHAAGISRAAAFLDIISCIFSLVDTEPAITQNNTKIWFRAGETIYYFVRLTAWTSGNCTFNYTVKKYKK